MLIPSPSLLLFCTQSKSRRNAQCRPDLVTLGAPPAPLIIILLSYYDLSYQHLFDNLSQCFEPFLVLLCKSSDKRTIYVQDSVKLAVEMKRNYYL